MDENLRKLIELAVLAGDRRMSTQTDYVHLKHHALPEEIQYTIPIVENYLFALSLFRTKSIENITKAKTLIEKLAFFQGSNGNFPVYLHETPECKDHYLAVQLLAPIYWICQGFQQILGLELKQRLQSTLLKLITYCLSISSNQEKHPPYFIRMRIAAASLAIGKLFSFDDLILKGQSLIKEFETPTNEWFEPKYLADLMVSSQMVNTDFSKSFLKNFWTHICQTWHQGLNSYIGPKLLEYQAGFEPEVTLYDLFLGYFTGNFSKRALKDDPLHLSASLIQATNDKIDDVAPLKSWTGDLKSQSFQMVREDTHAFAFTTQNETWNPAQDKGFSPFRLSWGSLNRIHTLVTEGGNSRNISFSKDGNQLEFLFNLGELPELEDKEKSREISFYFDLFEKCSVKIEGFSATTFKIGEEVQVKVDGFNFTLKFELVKGEGQFLGHFMRGNRPSQIANKGTQRFAAFDWQLFLRTIRRPKNMECVIKVVLKLN